MVNTLTWLVADSLTGQLVGRLQPDSWDYEDPLTGSAKGTVTIPIPEDADARVQAERVAQVKDWVTPHRRQIVVKDNEDRWWFGGPILTPPVADTRAGKVTVEFGDWRAWFYAAPIRPVDDDTRQDYIRVGVNNVEQCQAIADLATLGLATIGAPRLVVDVFVASDIERDVTHRMFKLTGEAMDNVARRERGPDWHTYISHDPIDPQKVVAHLVVSYPERRVATGATLRLHQRLFHKQDVGSNILTYKLPNPPVPPARVYGVGPTPPPGEEWATAENPDLEEGLRLAWDEVWRLPEGVTTGPSAFEHTLARLNAHSSLAGIAEMTIDPAITDLFSWGPGDRVRVNIDNGWDLVDKPDARILSRKLAGRGEHVTSVGLMVNLGVDDDTEVDEPAEEVEE